MRPEPAPPRAWSRRATIAWVGRAIATLATSPSFAAGSAGIGYDPDLLDPVVPWPLTLDAAQRKAVAALADVLLPADGRSPAASALGVPAFVDEWVSAPYPLQQADRVVILEGLAWLDKEAAALGAASFAELNEAGQAALCDRIRDLPTALAADRQAAVFFDRFRVIALGAYCTTDAGMADIGYVGNTPSATFAGPPAEVLERLGLLDPGAGPAEP
jgi:hypothetical protein